MRYHREMVIQHAHSDQANGDRTSERYIIDDRPHPVYIVTQSWRWILLGVLLWGLMIWLDGRLPGYGLGSWAWAVLGIVVVRVVLAAINRAVRVHQLTGSRVVAQYGILKTIRTELPLDRVQHLIVVRTLIERVFGIGSIGITSAGTGSVDLVWRGVEQPERVRETIRAVIEGDNSAEEIKKTPVIGLVGGIGSGKSTVAKAFADLGCVVSDSDKSGAEALRKPDVVKELVSWWGDEILDADGAVDRKKVAAIVFRDTDARTKLEELVHPMIHADRHALIESSRSDGDIRAVIVDAPLLYEAGVDSECDAVVFVQTPKRIRAQRVLQTRGWDESELDRREKAQMGLEHKRDRADHIVTNGGSLDELLPQVARILKEIESSL